MLQAGAKPMDDVYASAGLMDRGVGAQEVSGGEFPCLRIFRRHGPAKNDVVDSNAGAEERPSQSWLTREENRTGTLSCSERYEACFGAWASAHFCGVLLFCPFYRCSSDSAGLMPVVPPAAICLWEAASDGSGVRLK